MFSDPEEISRLNKTTTQKSQSKFLAFIDKLLNGLSTFCSAVKDNLNACHFLKIIEKKTISFNYVGKRIIV